MGKVLPQNVKFPDTSVLLRNLHKTLPLIDRGERMALYDVSGKKYLDAVGGALVMSLGHGHPELSRILSEQALKVAYINGTQFSSGPTEQLAHRLATLAKPLGLTHSMFLSSGSEAVEAALKFVRQLWVERGELKRTRFLNRVPSYHGNTLLALSVSGRPHYKKFYAPYLVDGIVSCQAPTPYRPFGGGPYLAEPYLVEVRKRIEETGGDTIAAMIVEPVIGSSLGAAAPPPGYFAGLRKLADQYGFLIIADEVMCGVGRVGTFFASEKTDLKPDLLTLGKGLSSGYTALSALMVKESYLQEMKNGSGYFQHMQTYLNTPLMTAVGNKVLELYERDAVLKNVQKLSAHWANGLSRLTRYPFVGSILSEGFMSGIEFVQDKAKKSPFLRKDLFVEKICGLAFEHGLILWSNIGHVNGIDGDLVMLGPPLNSTQSELDELIELIDHVFSKVS